MSRPKSPISSPRSSSNQSPKSPKRSPKSPRASPKSPKISPKSPKSSGVSDNDFFEQIKEGIGYSETPKDNIWVFNPLYSQDNNQNIRLWQIGFDGKNLRIRHGVVKTKKYQFENIQVIAKSNRNIQEQALLEARSRYEEKYRKDDYRPAGYEFPNDIKPELAATYKPGMIKYWPVAAMPKIDGIRCRFKLDSVGNVIALSRNNKLMAHLEYLNDELKLLFMYLPAGALIESEIYHPNFNYNDIQSIVMATKNRNPLLTIMGCYVFDIYYLENPPFEIRYNTIVQAYARMLNEGHNLEHIRFLSATLAYNDDQLKSFQEYYMGLGLEGLIIHKIAGVNPTPELIASAVYKQDRSTNLLKFKTFNDEEATVIAVLEGTGRESGLAIFEIRNNEGIVYNARPAFTFNERREYFQHPETALGRRGTVYFFGVSEYGVPRQPVFKCFRDLAV